MSEAKKTSKPTSFADFYLDDRYRRTDRHLRVSESVKLRLREIPLFIGLLPNDMAIKLDDLVRNSVTDETLYGRSATLCNDPSNALKARATMLFGPAVSDSLGENHMWEDSRTPTRESLFLLGETLARSPREGTKADIFRIVDQLEASEFFQNVLETLEGEFPGDLRRRIAQHCFTPKGDAVKNPFNGLRSTTSGVHSIASHPDGGMGYGPKIRKRDSLKKVLKSGTTSSVSSKETRLVSAAIAFADREKSWDRMVKQWSELDSSHKSVGHKDQSSVSRSANLTTE